MQSFFYLFPIFQEMHQEDLLRASAGRGRGKPRKASTLVPRPESFIGGPPRRPVLNAEVDRPFDLPDVWMSLGPASEDVAGILQGNHFPPGGRS